MPTVGTPVLNKAGVPRVNGAGVPMYYNGDDCGCCCPTNCDSCSVSNAAITGASGCCSPINSTIPMSLSSTCTWDGFLGYGSFSRDGTGSVHIQCTGGQWVITVIGSSLTFGTFCGQEWIGYAPASACPPLGVPITCNPVSRGGGSAFDGCLAQTLTVTLS